MDKQDRYIIPFKLGNELSQESFSLSQNDNTYLLASPRYKQFYSGYIRPRTAMYRGWIQGFHNMEYGVIPTYFLQKIGNGITSTIFSKPMILNSKDEATNAVKDKQYKKSNFDNGSKEGFGFALDGGTGLIKWNRDGNNQLRLEAIPVDRFFPTIGAYGDIERVKCFIATYHDTISASQEYHLCEERFFKYSTVAGETERFPMAHYLCYKTSSDASNESTPNPSDAITWSEIPYDIKKMIQKDYGSNILIDSEDYENKKKDNSFDKCILLPFDDDLGVRLLKFTRNIPSFPKFPFGQPLADLLMNENYAYDQLKFFERLEVYIARGRVMVDKGYVNPNDPDNKKSLLDSMVFTYYESMQGESNDKKPQGLQLDLRADDINRQKQNILNDTAFSLNLSSTSIAAWLSDGQTQKTAKEIEFERTKTTAFINDKIDIIQKPLQEMIDLFFHYYGVSAPELNIMPENQTIRSESIQLYSELYDKGQITAEMLAKEILGTCSAKEVDELSKFIISETQKKAIAATANSGQPIIPGGTNI